MWTTWASLWWIAFLLSIVAVCINEYKRYGRQLKSLRDNHLRSDAAKSLDVYIKGLGEIDDMTALAYMFPQHATCSFNKRAALTKPHPNVAAQVVDAVTDVFVSLPVQVVRKTLGAMVEIAKTPFENEDIKEREISVLSDRLSSQIKLQHCLYDHRQNKMIRVEEAEMLNNFHQQRIHVSYAPAIFDYMLTLYRRGSDKRLVRLGFQKTRYKGVSFYVLNGDKPATSSSAPPLLCFHGISSTMDWLPNLVRGMRDPGNQVIIFPRHPTLTYNMRDTFAAGEMMTTRQFIQTVTEYLREHRICKVNAVAWSFGGLMRNVFNSMAPAGTIVREVLVEPMGMPISNAVASTYPLMDFRLAYNRACQVAPDSNIMQRLHHRILLWYLRLPVHSRVLHTDAFFNDACWGRRGSWNRPETMVLLSAQDLVTPHAHCMWYFENVCKRTNFKVKPGVHGSWSSDPTFVREIVTHLGI